ncbi:phospholipase/carboxylesterase [Arcticibacter tournemirensis]|uniref:Prolyl oligopeptidase family serine peptidase n=1 Tax=Arcticibacter tournemirensis TaxID=699437 RepID=A0A5M9H1N8_9SPHI|nr:prolyl oligopeptidase family serine peptidase [Arcticibacter tournemirensis]KAA8480209.1 prolyl oligopeptidase family serine peptidase [Arcticibacter tournemirensis]TQM46768.1 phospholipase/carboxylesterase [Arcticibacter tournemirensis]
MKLKLFLLSLIILVSASLEAQDLKKYERSTFVSKNDTLPYRILFPEDFDSSKKYPVLFFLHGRGESGDNNESQLTHGGRLFLKKDIRKNYPAIIIFPQCPKDSYWANVDISTDSTGKRSFDFQKGGEPTKAMHALLGLVERMLEKPYADKQQIYVGGLSMGGMGTFELLRRKPEVFAAAFAICGGDNVKNVKKYRKIPLWIFHGAKDDIVDPQFSERIVEELHKKGNDVKFTVYPEANHNSWDSALAEPDLLPWLFSNIKD